MTAGGTENVEPIVPLGRLVRKIGCKVGWNDDGLVLVHPRRGKLKGSEDPKDRGDGGEVDRRLGRGSPCSEDFAIGSEDGFEGESGD